MSKARESELYLTLRHVGLKVAPFAVLSLVLVSGLTMVRSDPAADLQYGSTVVAPVQTKVQAQSQVQEQLGTETQAHVGTGTQAVVEASTAEPSDNNQEVVWNDISGAITNLNDLVGVELFLEVKREQKGQMEVRLDKSYWDRVQYQTRVDLKIDISDLWHLYATEYGYVESSVVYFVDDVSGKVIDIFSKVE